MTKFLSNPPHGKARAWHLFPEAHVALRDGDEDGKYGRAIGPPFCGDEFTQRDSDKGVSVWSLATSDKPWLVRFAAAADPDHEHPVTRRLARKFPAYADPDGDNVCEECGAYVADGSILDPGWVEMFLAASAPRRVAVPAD